MEGIGSRLPVSLIASRHSLAKLLYPMCAPCRRLSEVPHTQQVVSGVGCLNGEVWRASTEVNRGLPYVDWRYRGVGWGRTAHDVALAPTPAKASGRH